MKKIHKWERRILDVLKYNSEWDALEDYYTLGVVRVLSALPSLEKMTCRSFCLNFSEGQRVCVDKLLSEMVERGEVEIIFRAGNTEMPLFILLKGDYIISIKDFWRSSLRKYR